MRGMRLVIPAFEGLTACRLGRVHAMIPLLVLFAVFHNYLKLLKTNH